MNRLSLIVSFAVFHLFAFVVGDKCTWENCNQWKTDEDWINVHLICHTHDDLGWLKTVDQYYTGAHADITPVGVQYILNTVIEELERDPSRRFTWAETGFLYQWLNDHHDYERHNLINLVKNGQLEIVGGGWVQHDEAASHYIDIIDQMAYGLKLTNVIFGRCGVPRVAWQLDPFGHSRESANIFSMMGYEALFFARTHYLEMKERLENKSLEFIWRCSDELKSSILSSIFYLGTYGPPQGFCFDALCDNARIVDNENIEGYNLDEMLTKFIKHVRMQAVHQRTQHVILMMGSDFHYTNSNMWYTDLDKLIKHINEQEKKNKIHVFYSTPSCYVDAVNEAKPHLPIKTDDFFPYASTEQAYWTGYFTSRPTFKGFIRQSSGLLQMIKQLDAFANLGAEDNADLNVLREAMALCQHHDAVTGTAKENVTRDYEKRLAKGWEEAEQVINDAFSKILSRKGFQGVLPSRQQFCVLINETICEPVEKFGQLTVTVFNANSKESSSVIRIPFYNRGAVVQGATGERLAAQMVKAFHVPLGHDIRQAPYELIISVKVPALGFITLFVNDETNSSSKWHKGQLVRITAPIATKTTGLTSASSKAKNTHHLYRKGASSIMTNGIIELTFDESGRLFSMKNILNGKSIKLRQEFLYYEGMGISEQPSGAYIFRPNGTTAKVIHDEIVLHMIEGPVVNETRQTVNPWISQVIRLYKGKSYVEFEWTIGPIPKESQCPIAKEIVTRYSTDIASKSNFFTDSNGRQVIHRKRNWSSSFKYIPTEPVSGNYYPVSNKIFIRDTNSQLTVFTDRAEGGSSLEDGTVELMLHRRLFTDDGFGVDEALDEPGCDGSGLIARGRHWLTLDGADSAAKTHRPLSFELLFSPILSFAKLIGTPDEYRMSFITTYSGLTRALPENVHILTLEQWSGQSLLLRLEHIYQEKEDKMFSQPITVDLHGLFTAFEVTSIRELTLGANKDRSATASFNNATLNASGLSHDILLRNFSVELKPMEIKTFQLHIQRKNE